VHVGEVIAVIADPAEDISKYGSGASQPAASQQVSAPTQTDAASAHEQTPPRSPAPPVATAPQEASPTIEAQPAAEQPPTPAPPPGVHRPQPTTEEVRNGASTNGRLRASPVARRIARERGIDLHQVHGSGPDGRILRSDVEGYAASGAKPQAAPAPPPARRAAAPAMGDEVVRPSRMRQAIARRMSQSKREAPHYYLLVDIDMGDALVLRRQINDAVEEDARVTINDLIVRACAVALQRHPQFNATIEGDVVTRRGSENVCIAIAMDDGLIAPALIDTGNKSLAQIAGETKDLVGRAKGGSLRAEEMNDGTFTITNLGAYGIETLIGIIQPPQTAILGVGSVLEQPVARDGVIGTRQLMKVALSADHRVTDGAQGAQFLAEIKRLLEQPVLLLL
jgi:pyruvate dehydrogenase E2 component (dihydrolipoamide acetyltransferase)